MPTAATLSISVEAQVDQATQALRKVQGTVQETGDTVANALGKFEISGRGAKKALSEVAHSLGSVGGPAMDAAKYMLMMGPAAGIAVGAVAILNDVMEKQGERAKGTAEFLAFYQDALKKVGEQVGTRELAGPFTQENVQIIDHLQGKINKLAEAYEKESQSIFGSAAAMREINKETQATHDLQAIVLKQNLELDRLNQARKTFEDASFGTHIGTKAGTSQRDEGNLKNLTEYADQLKQQLNQLPQSGKDFEAVLKEWRNVLAQATDLNDQIWDKKNSAAKKALEDEKKITAEKAKQSAEAEKNWRQVATRAQEEIQNKNDAEMEQLREADRKNEEKIAAHKQKLEAEIEEKVQAMLEKDPKKMLGMAQIFDTSRVDVASLGNAGTKVQEVSDPTVAGYLRQLLEREDRIKNAANYGVTSE